MLDCSFERVLTNDEVLSMLCVSQEELMELEGRGLPFVKNEETHLYISSSVLNFIRMVEESETAESRARRGWPRGRSRKKVLSEGVQDSKRS